MVRKQLIEWARTAIPAVVSAIGLGGLVSALGAGIVWARFSAAGLPADQAVGDLPAGSMLVTGTVSLVLYLVLGSLALLLVYLFQGAVVARMVGPHPIRPLRRQLKVLDERLAELKSEIDGLGTPGAGTPEAERLATLQTVQEGVVSVRDEKQTDLYEARKLKAELTPSVPTLGNQWGLLVLVATEVTLVVIRAHLGGWGKGLLVGAVVIGVLAPLLTLSFAPNESSEMSNREHFLLSPRVVPFGLLPVAMLIVVMVVLPSWTYVPIGAAILLGGINLAIGKLHPRRFFWYGVAVFVSVALFGAVLTYNRTFHAPSAQGAAVLLKNGRVVTGLWIGESSSRVFLGNRETALGRIFWVDRNQVANESVGKLVRVKEATRNSLELGAELERLARKTQTKSAP